MLFGQPSTVLQLSGVAKLIDRLGLAQSNWTSPSATLASILHECVHKTDINGRKLWRQLRSLKGMSPDDNDADVNSRRQKQLYAFLLHHSNSQHGITDRLRF